MFKDFCSENRALQFIMWTSAESFAAFPLQQLLRETATMLRYTYIAYLATVALLQYHRPKNRFEANTLHSVEKKL